MFLKVSGSPTKFAQSLPKGNLFFVKFDGDRTIDTLIRNVRRAWDVFGQGIKKETETYLTLNCFLNLKIVFVVLII